MPENKGDANTIFVYIDWVRSHTKKQTEGRPDTSGAALSFLCGDAFAALTCEQEVVKGFGVDTHG